MERKKNEINFETKINKRTREKKLFPLSPTSATRLAKNFAVRGKKLSQSFIQ
jgi:hypothetical protein